VVDRVTIAISRETAERLKKLGKYGDTMDSIIHRVLDEYEKLEIEQPHFVQSVIVALSIPLIVNVMSTATVTGLPCL
jgi:hypothetical protein